MSKHQAIQNPENVCFNCLKEVEETEINKIHIPEMGYGSGFDGWSTRIHLCNDCFKLTNSEWWKLKEIQCNWDKENNHGFYEYECEKEIFNFVDQLPLEGQELFWNRYSTDSHMEGQDWIDYQLGILPHEKCKEYGCYSPEEIQAYKERFPICNNVKIIIYEDNSKGSRCPFKASGNEDGTSEDHQPSTKCYKCEEFKIRNGEIKVMDKEEFEIYQLKNKLEMEILLEKIREKFKNIN